jgi:hypothetical protein
MENDVLLYLDNRFDSINKHQNDVNNKLFDKLDAIHTQTLKTNGRVNALEDKHLKCAINEVKDFVTAQKQKDTKQYKLGDLILTAGLAGLMASAIVGFITIISK